MITIQDIIEISQNYDEYKVDIFAKLDAVEPISNFEFYLQTGIGLQELEWEEHSYYQFWHRLMDYFINGKPKIFSNSVIRHFWENEAVGNFALNHHITEAISNQSSVSTKDLCFRLYGKICRAVLSEQYGSILNTELLEALKIPLQLLSEDYRIIDYKITRDSVMIKALYKDFNVADGSYGAGVYIFNDEIGKGALRLGTLIKRGQCDNTTILSNVKTLYHRTNVTERLQNFLPNFSIALKETEQYIVNFENLKKIPLKNFTEEIEAFQKKHQLTIENVLEFEHGMEGEYNMWGWCNGLTAMAKMFEDNRRTDFEMMAGDLMMRYIKVAQPLENV